MMPFNQGTIYSNLTLARHAAGPLRRQAVTLLRFSLFTQPSSPALQPQRTDVKRPITGIFKRVTAQMALDSNGFYTVGNVVSHTEVEILGTANETGAVQQPDMMIYEGKKYVVKGKPNRAKVTGSRAFTVTEWEKA